jgi:hypothetical protein
LVAVAAGAWITVFPGPAAMAAVGGILAISGLIVSQLGLYIGR